MKRLFLTLFALAWVSSSASADFVRVEFFGVVSGTTTDLSGGPISIGDTITGDFVLDTDATPNIQYWGSSNEWSQTFFEGGLDSIVVRTSGYFFEFENGFVRTDTNTSNQTQFGIHTRSSDLVATNLPYIAGVPFSSLAISFPPFPFEMPLDSFPSTIPVGDYSTNPATMYLLFTEYGNSYVSTSLTRFVAHRVQVPSPPASLLVAFGLLGLLGIGRNSAVGTRRS